VTKWLDRALFISPYHYLLCLTEKAYRKELRRLKYRGMTDLHFF